MSDFRPLFKFVSQNTISFMAKPFSFYIILFLVFAFIACTDNETARKKNVNPAEIFFDYKIRSQENDSTVSVYLLYRMGGPNGNAIKLTDPAKVELDGETIPFDSARVAGAYYDIERPADGFAGKHTIVFTDFNNREYIEEFIFKPFKLKTKMPPGINRGDLVLDFAGLANEDYIRVILTDTSFMSRDIHEIDTIENNRLVITADKLRNLVNGPITVQFYKEIERPIKNVTRGGGKISISYGIQREFELKP